jgi:transposase
MAEPLSEDLRKRLIAAIEGGATRRAAAERFGVVASTVTKLVKHLERTGSIAPAKRGGDRRSDRVEAYADEIMSLVAVTPDITLEEISEHLQTVHGEAFVVSTLWRCLDRHGLTFKKNGTRKRAGASGRRRSARSMARNAA